MMEEAAARHAETVHYSASAGIRVGGSKARKESKVGFCPTMLEGLAGARLKKDEADRAEKRVREITGWSDPVEEKTGFVEAAYQNYERTSGWEEPERPGSHNGTRPDSGNDGMKPVGPVRKITPRRADTDWGRK